MTDKILKAIEEFEAVREKAIPEIINVLIEALKEDEGYFYSWQSNIAVQFQDAWHNSVETEGLPCTQEQIHEISNKAAISFLNILCHTAANKKPANRATQFTAALKVILLAVEDADVLHLNESTNKTCCEMSDILNKALVEIERILECKPITGSFDPNEEEIDS